MDVQINCEECNVSRAYGNKISVSLENVDINDITGEKSIIEAIDMEAYIDTVGETEILDFMGDRAVIEYLTGKGYEIKEV